MKNYFISLTFLLLALPHPGSTQDRLVTELQYAVNVNHPPLSITKEELKEANTLTDLFEHYKSSWVREYISVEVLVSHQGREMQVVGENDTLSQDQKIIMKMADPGTDIAILIQYIPENTLNYNEAKEEVYKFMVIPDRDAQYPGGYQALSQYIKENLIDNISPSNFGRYQLAVTKFFVDEEGQVVEPHIFWTSHDEKIDKKFLEIICNMPDWKPAEYADGTKIKQEFALSVGDMESCVINMLNIREEQ